jgi:Ferric reductase like transmembrane component
VGVSLTWVTMRAAGYTSFALLTASVALGLLLSSQWRSVRWPRFATTELHRFVTLLALIFIAIHVLVALLDRFIRFRPIEVLVPFVSHYRPAWTGLGIVAAYLAAAVWATTWLQRLIGYRWWRRLHYATFAVYMAAAVHGIGSGSDTGSLWSWALYLASFALVGALLALRLAAREQRQAPRTAPAGAAPAPPSATGGLGAVPAWTGRPVEEGFWARLEGRMQQRPDGDGGVLVQLDGTLWGGFDGWLRLLVRGSMPPGGDRMRVRDNWLYLQGRDGARYQGRISAFDRVRLWGHISADHREAPPLAITIELIGTRAGVVSGTVRVMLAGADTPARLGSSL